MTQFMQDVNSVGIAKYHKLTQFYGLQNIMIANGRWMFPKRCLMKEHLPQVSNCFVFSRYICHYISNVCLSITSFSNSVKYLRGKQLNITMFERKSGTHCISIELLCKKGWCLVVMITRSYYPWVLERMLRCKIP